MSSSLLLKGYRVVMCGFAVATLAACGHDQVRRASLPEAGSETRVVVPKARNRSTGERAAVVAVRQIGIPYQYGGSTTRGFDCSGLVQYAYANVGKHIPRTTTEQWRQLTPVNGNNLRVGDLLFFRIAGKVSHVGMYLGNRRFVHAPSTGRQVSTASLDSDYYRRAFIRAARPY